MRRPRSGCAGRGPGRARRDARRQAIEPFAKPASSSASNPASTPPGAATDGMYAQRLGVDRAPALNPFARAGARRRGAGVRLGPPVTPLDPWGAVRAAAFHRTPEHRAQRARRVRRAHPRRLAGAAAVGRRRPGGRGRRAGPGQPGDVRDLVRGRPARAGARFPCRCLVHRRTGRGAGPAGPEPRPATAALPAHGGPRPSPVRLDRIGAPLSSARFSSFRLRTDRARPQALIDAIALRGRAFSMPLAVDGPPTAPENADSADGGGARPWARVRPRCSVPL